MTTPQSQDTFLRWLSAEIEAAKETASENKDFPNSYGAGYDSGVLAGLQQVQQYYYGPTE